MRNSAEPHVRAAGIYKCLELLFDDCGFVSLWPTGGSNKLYLFKVHMANLFGVAYLHIKHP